MKCVQLVFKGDETIEDVMRTTGLTYEASAELHAFGLRLRAKAEERRRYNQGRDDATNEAHDEAFP